MGISPAEVTSVAVTVALCLLGRVIGSPLCGVDDRPKGICGDKLVRTRNTLCQLLSLDYPDIFKRSMDDNLLDLPVDVIAQIHLNEDFGEDFPDQAMPSENKALSYSRLLHSTKMALGAISARKREEAGKELVSVEKRGLVCDCCYNTCVASVMAQYC